MAQFVAKIIGIPHIPSITEIRVRPGPTTQGKAAFKVKVGTTSLSVLEVQPDSEGRDLGGKIYTWLKLQFPDGTSGFVRDDLIEVVGDGTWFGYPNVAELTVAFNFSRDPEAARKAASETVEHPSVADGDAGDTTQTTTWQAKGDVRIRAQPTLSGEEVRWLTDGEQIVVDLNSRTEADGYIWYQHQEGWSAQGSIDGSRTYLIDPASLSSTSPPSETGIAPPSISSREGFGDVERVKKASFALTGAYEGPGYTAYNNYDTGIVSYGIIQFTLAAGSLVTVIQRYLAVSQSDTADQIRSLLPRIEARDANLRTDLNFKNLLIAAGSEEAMKDAQNSVATEKYWDKVWNGYIVQRGLETPLGWALLFDMGVNFGTGHGFVRLAENQLGVPPRSRPGENGITEEQLITRVTELRKQSHDKQAREDNLPGLAARGNFWMGLVNQGDWGLQGDSSGNVIANGARLQVRNP